MKTTSKFFILLLLVCAMKTKAEDGFIESVTPFLDAGDIIIIIIIIIDGGNSHFADTIKIVSYAQGYQLMRAVAAEQGWNLNYGGIALMGRGGCIIRSAFLGKIKHENMHIPVSAQPADCNASVRSIAELGRRCGGSRI